jgi:CTP:molybdopterin cytidylyltransferase MocA
LSQVPTVILAAGAGRRMGGPKALLEFQGETLLHRALRMARGAGCGPLIAVLGDWDPGPLDPDVCVIRNPEAAEGMAASIRLGTAALPPDAEAVLFLTVDQPAVDVDLLRRLLELGAVDPGRPAACAYSGTLGIPALLPRRLFPDLLALQGDRGAKSILQREGATSLPFPGGEADLDTPADLEGFRH